MMQQAMRRPDVEITRKMKNGSIRSYGHLYWKPFLLAIHLFHRTYLIRDRKLQIWNHAQQSSESTTGEK